MKIGLLDNGLDSLQKGFLYLNNYEKKYYLQSEKTGENLYNLKDAIIFIHHGIEILMKYILFNESEYLIFSEIDKNVKNAFTEKRNKKLNSIFETSLSNKIHTVTFDEAISRIINICGFNLGENLKRKLDTLQDYRNQITHAEITFNEHNINNLFEGFVDELDSFLFKTIGDEYKTLSGYSELIKNYEVYKEYLKSNNKKDLENVLDCFMTIFKEIGIGMGFNDVKLITDINIVTKIFDELYKNKLYLGTDLYNGFCSGDISSVKRIDKNRLSMFAKDNNSEYIFHFKSLLIYMPSLVSGLSPIFYFESDKDIELPNNASDKEIKTDYFDGKILEGIYFDDIKETIYDSNKINEFYCNLEYNENFIVPPHHEVYRFLSKCIFCFINIQGLDYGSLDISKVRNYSLKQLEVALRAEL